MARLRPWLLLTLLLGSLVSGVGPANAAPPEESRVTELINAQRVEHGLSELRYNAALAGSASRYSWFMATANFFSHTGPDGSSMVGRNEAAGFTDWRFLGENLAAGQPTPERVVTAWMNSPGHRKNILSSDAAEIGIGHAFAPGSRYHNYWTMEIGARW